MSSIGCGAHSGRAARLGNRWRGEIVNRALTHGEVDGNCTLKLAVEFQVIHWEAAWAGTWLKLRRRVVMEPGAAYASRTVGSRAPSLLRETSPCRHSPFRPPAGAGFCVPSRSPLWAAGALEAFCPAKDSCRQTILPDPLCGRPCSRELHQVPKEHHCLSISSGSAQNVFRPRAFAYMALRTDERGHDAALQIARAS